MVPQGGFEPPTTGFSVQRSYRKLSYRGMAVQIKGLVPHIPPIQAVMLQITLPLDIYWYWRLESDQRLLAYKTSPITTWVLQHTGAP